ncbi:MAG: cytochrome P450, partial [Phyllobacteriaceae bacterium]|nr:cytochrome P450 [Phyllobacteriaceae bacterium]
ATLTSRIAEEAIEWQGNIIEKGAPLMMWWAAGNLDERMFPDPTRFDPNRRPNRHLAFGIGGHACIGRQIASIVAEEAVSTFLMHPAHRIQQNTRPVFLPRLTRMVEVAPITVI